MNPARRTDLLVRDLGEETVVYDSERHQAHCLNAVASRVFGRCDGTQTVAAIAAAVGIPSSTVVHLLDHLAHAGLLQEAPVPPPATSPASRRDVLRQAMVAAVVVPAVLSVPVLAPAQAGGTGCTDANDELYCSAFNVGQPCFCWTNPYVCDSSCQYDPVRPGDDDWCSPCGD